MNIFDEIPSLLADLAALKRDMASKLTEIADKLGAVGAETMQLAMRAQAAGLAREAELDQDLVTVITGARKAE